MLNTGEVRPIFAFGKAAYLSLNGHYALARYKIIKIIIVIMALGDDCLETLDIRYRHC